MSESDRDYVYTVETDDDELEVAFVVRSLRGKKVTQEDFVDQIEEYLDEMYGRKERSLTH